MDLETIRMRYNNGWYDSISKFLTDFKLIFSNCYRFNSPTTDIHGMARDLEIYCQEFLAPLGKTVQEGQNKNVKTKVFFYIQFF